MNILTSMLMFSLVLLSYQLRLFERYITPEFAELTTSMWNMMITLTTVGYGDYYPKSHMGRCIGIIIAFWGVFFVSLWVVALTNVTEHSSPEKKAFMLLQRLSANEALKTEATGMLSASYRMKLNNRR